MVFVRYTQLVKFLWQGNVYESLGRPPAIREDQQLEGDFGMLPPLSSGIGDRPPSYIGRNASFDRYASVCARCSSVWQCSVRRQSCLRIPVGCSKANRPLPC